VTGRGDGYAGLLGTSAIALLERDLAISKRTSETVTAWL
jgi:hypothetical protein